MMHKIIDTLIPVLGALTLAVFVVAVLDFEQIIHLSNPIRQALANYGMASVVIAVVGAITLIIQRVIDLRRLRQKSEKLSRSLDSPDETPAHQ